MRGDALPDPIRFTVLQLGRDIYMQGDEAVLGTLPDGKEWVRVDPKLVPQTNISTSQYADFLREAGGVKKSGTTQIDGTNVTLYTGTLTAQQIADAMGGETAKQMKQQLAGNDVKMPIRAWLDDQRRPRRINVRFEVEGIKMDMTTDMSDFGLPVEIEAPPAGTVADADEVTGG